MKEPIKDLCICINTKGRAESFPIKKWLTHVNVAEIPVILVVEKEEYEEYKFKYPDYEYLILPESNKGIGYSRFVSLFSLKDRFEYVANLDDDITDLFVVEGTKLIRANTPDLVYTFFSRLMVGFDVLDIITLAVGYAVAANARSKSPATINFGLMGVSFVCYRMKMVRDIEYYGDPDLRHVEDRVLAFTFYLAGYEVGVWMDFAYLKVYPDTGGCNVGSSRWKEDRDLYRSALMELKTRFPIFDSCMSFNEKTGKTLFRWKKMREIRNEFLTSEGVI